MVQDLVHQAPLGKNHYQVLKFDHVCYLLQVGGGGQCLRHDLTD